jgi:hypothetical protein
LRPYFFDPDRARPDDWKRLFSVLDTTTLTALRGDGVANTWAAHRGWIKNDLRGAALSLDAKNVDDAIRRKIARESVLGNNLPQLDDFILGSDGHGLALFDVLDLMDDDLQLLPAHVSGTTNADAGEGSADATA